jgi:tetratricopeptide (TPR) repeat protein
VQAGVTPGGIRWALTTGAAANWHPLTWISHMVDWSFFEDDPRGHHAMSVVWHALNAVLVFLLFRRLTNAFWFSALSAALFAWHPLRVESVAWIAERKDVLSAFFGLFALWAYVVYTQQQQRNRRWYWVSLGAFALGLLAKPMLVTLPLIMLLLDIWPLQKKGSQASGSVELTARRELAPPRFRPAPRLEKLPFFLLAAASCAITLIVQRAGGSISTMLPLGARIANAFVAILGYLEKFIWPNNLAVLYPHPGSWPATTIAVSILLFGMVTFAALSQFRKRPWLAIGWFWFVIMLLPVLGLVHIGLHYMADRYTYLPVLGLQLALLSAFAKSPRPVFALLAVTVLSICVLRTWSQLGVWKNSFTLFDHALSVTHDNYLAYNNRGLSFDRAGRLDEAIADYKQALAINPHYAEANNNFGQALTERGRPRDGIELFRAAHKANPNLIEAHNNLGNALADDGKPDQALPHYDFVLARQPWNVSALSNSGIALAMLGRYSEAIARLEKAMQLAPDNLNVERNLAKARALKQQGR